MEQTNRPRALLKKAKDELPTIRIPNDGNWNAKQNEPCTDASNKLILNNPHFCNSSIPERSLPLSSSVSTYSPGYKLSSHTWKDHGVMEVTISRCGPSRRNKPERKPLKVRSQSEHNQRVQKRNHRANSRLRRKALSMNIDHLVTLTYRENMTDPHKARADFKRFLHNMRLSRPDLQYIAVWDRQDRGSVHWHLGLVGYQNIELLKKVWFSIVGQTDAGVANGSVNVKSYAGNTLALACYLSKAFKKGQEGRRPWERRFWSSHGCSIPKSVTHLGEIPFSKALLIGKRTIRKSMGVEPLLLTGHHRYPWAFLAAYPQKSDQRTFRESQAIKDQPNSPEGDHGIT